MDGGVDGIEQASDLVDAEEGIGVVDEREDDFAGCECSPGERCVARVREDIAAVGTPETRTVFKDSTACCLHSRQGASSQARLQCRSIRLSNGSGRNAIASMATTS